MNIGETLRRLRKTKGLSQQTVAEGAKISRTHLSLIESGDCNPTIDTLDSIGKVLNIPFPILSFLSLDIKSIPEHKRKDFLEMEPTIMAMIEDFFLKES